MKIKKALVCGLLMSSFIPAWAVAQQTNFFDDFNSSVRSNLWAVYGNTTAPAVLVQTNGVLMSAPRGVDDDGTLGYVTAQRFPWNDSGTSYVYSLWISNITATVTSSMHQFSVRTALSLLSDPNKHYLATNALSLFAEYWPESNTISLAVLTKTNKYYGGSPWGGNGDTLYRGYFGNVSNLLNQGAIRLSLELRSGVFHVRAHAASGQEIPAPASAGAPSGRHGLTNLYNPLVMLVVDNESAGFPYGKGYALFDKIQMTEQDTAIPDTLIYDDFSDNARFNFWETTSPWKLTESNGVLNAFQMSANSDDNFDYYISSNGLPMNHAQYAYTFKATLSNIHVDAGTGMKTVLFASDDKNNPWLSANNIYLAGEYRPVSDNLAVRLMIERQGGAQFGEPRFYGLITGFSHYVSSGGLDVELTLSNGLYSLCMKDSAQQPVSFQGVTGSLVGVHYLDSILTNAHWAIGAANLGVSTGRVEWAGTRITQMTARSDLHYAIWDDFNDSVKGSWWNFLLDSFLPGMVQAGGYLAIDPGYADDSRSGYAAVAPVIWSPSVTACYFQASLSTVTVSSAGDENADLRGLFYLTPNPSNDYWVSSVALSLFTEYRASDHRILLKLYTKTNATSSFGTLRFSGTIPNYQEILANGPMSMTVKLHGDSYALDVRDGTGAQVVMYSETGYRCGSHELGSLMSTSYWVVGAQNVGTGRGVVNWTDAKAWSENSIGADVNTNGIPDWWEQQYFGSPTGANPIADPDNDGANNASEFMSLTDPLDNSSVFEAQGVTPSSSGGEPGVRVSWLGMVGRMYDVEVAEGAVSNDMGFAVLPGARNLSPSVSNQVMTVSDSAVTSVGEKTYLVVVRVP
jgi:hypothetical protein